MEDDKPHDSDSSEGTALDSMEQPEWIKSLSSLDICKKKIAEYMATVHEKDACIQKLERILQECTSQRDILANEAEAQSNHFMNEIAALQQQLKDATSVIGHSKRTGVSLVEHIELKNKLIHMQQDRSEEKKALELAKEQLRVQSQSLKDLDAEYKLLIMSHTEVKEREEALVRRHSKEMEREAEKHRVVLEQERQRYEDTLKYWKDEANKNVLFLTQMGEEKAKVEKENGALRLHLEEAIVEVSRISSLDQTLARENERMENLRKELRLKHEQDLEELRTKYKSEVEMVTQQIDQLERSQEEEQMEVKRNLEKIHRDTLHYKTLLENERSRCEHMMIELEKASQRCAVLESEVTMFKSVASNVDVLTKEKSQLQSRISELEAQRVFLEENGRKDEVEKIKIDYEKEKAMKDEINLKFQELDTENKSLVTHLRATEMNLEEALQMKEGLKNEIENFKSQLKSFNQACSNHPEELSKPELDLQVSTFNQRIHTLSSSLESLEHYKEECHSIKKRIMNLVKMLRERKSYLDMEVTKYKSCREGGICNHLSFLEEHLVLMSTSLEESLALTGECYSALNQNSLCKDELSYQQLAGQTSVSCSLAKDMTPNFSIVTDEIGSASRLSIGCQTCPVLTQETAFQTSGMVNASEGVFASKTIEEDYIMEEIFVLPAKMAAMKGSVSLKNLKEIGFGADDGVSFSTSIDVNDPTPLTLLEYDQLRTKFHESQFLVKSLENENFNLKRALQFKNNLTDGNTAYIGQGKGVVQQVVNSSLGLHIKNASTQTEWDLPLVSMVGNEGTNELRKNLLDTMAEKLELLQKGEGHLRQIESLERESSQFRYQTGRDAIKESIIEMAASDSGTTETRALSEEGVPVDKIVLTDGEDHKSMKELDAVDFTTRQRKLSLQMQIAEALKQEVEDSGGGKTPVKGGSPMPEEWILSLRTLLSGFVDSRCPGTRRKVERVTQVAQAWSEVLRRAQQGLHYSADADTEQVQEKDGNTPSFSPLLQQLKNLLKEQRELQKAMKELENNLICALTSQFSSCAHEAPIHQPGAMYSIDGLSGMGGIAAAELEAAGVGTGARGRDAEMDLLCEFEEMTSAMVIRAQEEKMEVVQSQRAMILKILEENQARISEICNRHRAALREMSVEGSSSVGTMDTENHLTSVAEEIELSLDEELRWIEGEYNELLRQYSHEQSLHSQSHSLTLREFRQRISALLQHAKCRPSLSNIELWKPLLSLLSQVTLNLLHYYTVSQRFANHEGDSDLMPNAFPGTSRNPSSFYSSTLSPNDEGSDGDGSLRGVSLPDECVMTGLDSTGASEGILEDLDRSEQVKGLLTVSYPHLIKALKGDYEQVSLSTLEGEVQELVISLQAAAGMLRVLMLRKGEAGSPESSRADTAESGIVMTRVDHPCRGKQDPPLLHESLRQESVSSVPTREREGSGVYFHAISGDTESVKDPSYDSLSLSSPAADDYTLLKPPRDEAHHTTRAELIAEMMEAKKKEDALLTQLHQIQGLYAGQVDEKEELLTECAKLQSTIEQLAAELQTTKARLGEWERRPKESEAAASKKNKKPPLAHSMKDKVKAALAARELAALCRDELCDRVRELENLLEEVIRDRDKSVQELNLKVSDLTLQLEVADRQLRSSRQFLEEQATERDQEVDELVRANEKLKEQLKEKEAVVGHHAALQKEMRMLEKELREKYVTLGEANAKREETQGELAAALDKVEDLREVVQSVEMQLAAKCAEERRLCEQNDALKLDLEETRHHNAQLTTQLENALKQSPISAPTLRTSPTHPPFDFGDPRKYDSGGNHGLQKQISLSEELESDQTPDPRRDYVPPSSMPHTPQNLDLSCDASLLENLIARLERSTLGLEALQMTLVPEEDLSDAEISVISAGGLALPSYSRRALSPASLEAKLEEKLFSFERSAEAAAKYTKDLEMRLRNVKKEFDELMCERDELHQQLSTLSSLKAELEKASGEFAMLRQDFESNVLSLEEQLEHSKKREETLQKQLKDMKTAMEAQTMKSESLLEMKRTRAEKDNRHLEDMVGEVKQEREMLRRQNSEHLIKISGLEARLEEFRRIADSPYELELRARIGVLQDELERNRGELTARVREIEELRYLTKELREKLVLREEELDRAHQPSLDGPISIPQSSKERSLQHIQALEDEVSKLRSANQKLQKKSRSPVQKSDGEETKASNTLLECLLEDKNTRIEELQRDKDALEGTLRMGVAYLGEGRSPDEITRMLRKCLTRGTWDSTLENESSVGLEIQRRAPDTSSEIVQNLLDEEKPNLGEDSGESSDPLHSTARSIKESLSLESLAPPSTSHVNAFTKRHRASSLVSTLTGDKRLEEDFEATQSMLEAKEAEIETLMEEVEDGLPAPLPHPVGGRTQDELMTELVALEKRCRQLEEVGFREAESIAAAQLEDLRLKENDWEKQKEALMHRANSAEGQLEAEVERCQRLWEDLSAREQDFKDLPAQLERLMTQFKDANRRHEKRIQALERDHFREMQDLKAQEIDREKKLSHEFDRKLSAEVGELTAKLAREKDAMAKLKEDYETLLAAKPPKEDPKSHPPARETTSSSKNSSSDELQRDVRHELEVSAALDLSLLCYLDASSTGSAIGSRESSVLSEGPGTQEVPSEVLKIKSLMRKVHKEGIQVLTLSELLFLQGRQSGGIVAEELEPGALTSVANPGHNDRQERSREQKCGGVDEKSSDYASLQSKEQMDLLKFGLLQEKGFIQELQEALKNEKQEAEDLRRQLGSERVRHFEATSELVRLKCQSQLVDKELRLAHGELCELRERDKTSQKQIQDLEESLSAERNNFNHVSITLNHQRKLAASSTDHHKQLIKELRNSLERERTRVLALVSEVHDLKFSKGQPQPLPLEDSAKSGRDTSSSSLVEKEIQLAVAADKAREWQQEASDLQEALHALTEERAYERERGLREVREERLQAENLRNSVIKLESQKNVLTSELEEKTRMIRHLEQMAKNLRAEAHDKATQDPPPKKDSRRSCPDGDLVKLPNGIGGSPSVPGALPMTELHAPSQAKLVQKDAEVASLKRKLTQLEAELRLFEEKERVIFMETQRGTGSFNPNVAPHIKNLTELLEIQQGENVELCKSLARLTDDRHLLRQRILMLEGIVDQLNLQLATQEKFMMQENLNEKNNNCAERAALAAEAVALKRALSQSELRKKELEKAVMELEKSCQNQVEVMRKRDNLNSRYMYWKYSRSESYRRALVWQKKYLIQLLKGYQATEKRAIGRLTTLARGVLRSDSPETSMSRYGNDGERRDPNETAAAGPKARFRSCVFVVVAVKRMKILVKRWQLKSKVKGIGKLITAHSADFPSPSPSPEPSLQASSVDSGAGLGSRAIDLPDLATYASDTRRRSYEVTGLTPPTNERPRETGCPSALPCPSSRNLFGRRKDECDLNDCIQRLDYIHSQLGLPQAPT